MKKSAGSIVAILAFAAALLPAGAQSSAFRQDADPGAWLDGAHAAGDTDGSPSICNKHSAKSISAKGIDPAYMSMKTYSDAQMVRAVQAAKKLRQAESMSQGSASAVPDKSLLFDFSRGLKHARNQFP